MNTWKPRSSVTFLLWRHVRPPGWIHDVLKGIWTPKFRFSWDIGTDISKPSFSKCLEFSSTGRHATSWQTRIIEWSEWDTHGQVRTWTGVSIVALQKKGFGEHVSNLCVPITWDVYCLYHQRCEPQEAVVPGHCSSCPATQIPKATWNTATTKRTKTPSCHFY